MNNSKRKFKPCKLKSVSVAQSWMELGILPVPLYPKMKKPKGGQGWNAFRATPETLETYFEEGDNVGGLWGEPSGWVVDIDLDWDEAARAAPLLLPETFIYGRRSRPGTHYLYRCKGILGSKRIASKDTGIIIEIRSTGSQSVLPPSIHPDNERYEINHDTDFKTISRLQLEQCVNVLSAAAVLARNYPDSGGRHDYIHAITGTLLWAGWTEEKTKNFLNAVLEAVGDREDDRPQRDRTIENTIEHFQKGNRIAGWRTLSQWLPGEVLQTVRKWLIAKEQTELPPDFKPPEEDKTWLPPPELLRVPGLVGKLADWSSARAYLKQPVFDLAVGLMCMAVISSNKYVVDGWDTPLQPYFMLLAPTAGGKESALENVYAFAKRMGLGDYAFQGFQSYHALLDRLSNPPNLACWLWDESARRMKSAGRSIGSQDFQVMTWLLSLYGRANTSSPGIPGRHNAIPPVDHPFLTVMATSQPTQMMEAITDSDLSTGLINRFVLFDCGDILPPPNMDRNQLFPSAIEEGVKRIRAVPTPVGEYPFIKVQMEDTKTWAMFRDFDYEARSQAFKGGGGELWGRANQNALILAGLVAIGVDPRRPRITQEIGSWATQFIRWSCGRWVTRIDESASRSMVEHQSKTIEKYIRYPAKFIPKVTRKVEVRLMEQGVMPRNVLYRLCRHLRERDLEDALNHLVASDLICSGELEGVEVLWVKHLGTPVIEELNRS